MKDSQPESDVDVLSEARHEERESSNELGDASGKRLNNDVRSLLLERIREKVRRAEDR